MKHLLYLCLFAIAFGACDKLDDISGDVPSSGSDSDDSTTATVDTFLYEVEDGVYSEELTVETSTEGYSGDGYLYNFSNSTDSVVITTDSITGGYYDLYVGYTTFGWGAKECYVTVNGLSATACSLADTTGFSESNFGAVKLLDGVNTIKVSAYWTWFGVDYVKLVTNNDQTEFDIDPCLVTSHPSKEAVNVYNFLLENFQTNVITGTMADYNTNIDEAEWVHDATGEWPALAGFDFIDYNRQWSWIDYDELVDNAIDYWDNNGLVAIMWHWRDPSKESTYGFYDESTSYEYTTDFDIAAVQDSTSDEYQYVINDIDTIATYLQELEDAKVPVLWRPLHEAAGGWFWWGGQDPEDCAYLWQLMFDRLVNYHHLSNLIWVWTTDAGDDALDWYPGDEYVDIVGMDIYADDHNSQYINFDNAKEIFGGKKMITLSECGRVPSPDQMEEYGDVWSWFMTWNGDATETENDWDELFSYDFVYTRDDMPSLK